MEWLQAPQNRIKVLLPAVHSTDHGAGGFLTSEYALHAIIVNCVIIINIILNITSSPSFRTSLPHTDYGVVGSLRSERGLHPLQTVLHGHSQGNGTALPAVMLQWCYTLIAVML
jgi:hypothetical protein